MSKFIASIDVGTTNIKINLFNATYEVIDTVKAPHFTIYKTDSLFEMDLEEIWGNIRVGLKDLISRNAISNLEVILTTAMHRDRKSVV